MYSAATSQPNSTQISAYSTSRADDPPQAPSTLRLPPARPRRPHRVSTDPSIQATAGSPQKLPPQPSIQPPGGAHQSQIHSGAPTVPRRWRHCPRRSCRSATAVGSLDVQAAIPRHSGRRSALKPPRTSASPGPAPSPRLYPLRRPPRGRRPKGRLHASHSGHCVRDARTL